MITFLLNGVFFLYVLLVSLKQKEYRYTAAAAMVALYFIFLILQNNFNLVESSQVFGWVQKIMLVIHAIYMAFVWLKSADRKSDFLPAVFACMACALRFLRTFVFDQYTSAMKASGADVQAVYQEFFANYTIVDSATKFALVLVMFCMAWNLGKPKATNS